MYEWETDYLEVPAPRVSSRDRTQETQAPPPEPPAVDVQGPGFLGAFSALIQRISPAEAAGPAPSVNSRGSRDAATAGESVGHNTTGSGGGSSNSDANPSSAAPSGEAAGSQEAQVVDPTNGNADAGLFGGFGWARLFNGRQEENNYPTAHYTESRHQPSREVADPREDHEESPRGTPAQSEQSPDGVNEKVPREHSVIPVKPGDDTGHGVRLDIFNRLVLGCITKYSKCGPNRCPCCCCLSYLIFFGVVIGLGIVLRFPELETNFDAFMKTDVTSSTQRDTFTAALGSRSDSRRLQQGALLQNDSRRLQGALLYKQNDLYIAYELRDDAKAQSIFEAEPLTQIANWELALRNNARFKDYCDSVREEDYRRLCRPGISLINYALPTLDIEEGSVVPTQMNFDGLGRDIVPMETYVRLLERHDLQKIVLPQGFQTSQAPTTRMIRSAFRFKLFCCTSVDAASYQKKIVDGIKKEWDVFVHDVLFPILQEADDSDDQLSEIRIWFDGTSFEKFEVMDALWGDLRLAGGSMAFVLCYLVFHTRSIFLGVSALILCVLSVPLSYVLFTFMAGTQTLSIASFLSLFLVVGLGSDVVFVYTDFWRDAKVYKDGTLAQMVWTLKYAGKASLATTITTALSFFANLASVLRPLREFGLFMGLCVVLVWVLLTLMYVPLCIVDDKWFRRCQLRCVRQNGSQRENGGGFRNYFFGRLTYYVERGRRTSLLVGFLLWVLALVLSLQQAETDTGVPAIFPEDHNQIRGQEVLENFRPPDDVLDPLFAPPPLREDVCKDYDFQPEASDGCFLFWCEVNGAERWNQDPNQCQCYRNTFVGGTCPSANQVLAVTRFIGPEQITLAQLDGPIASHVDMEQGTLGLYRVLGAVRNQKLPAPVLQQEWETGDTVLKPIWEVTHWLNRADSNAACGWNEMCFCGTYVCALPSTFRKVSDITLETSDPGGRRLANHWQVATPSQANVEVVFGIEVNQDTPLLGEPEEDERWSFLAKFDLSQPWAQRNLYTFCKDLPADLRVVQRDCWIQDFYNFLNLRQEKFPVVHNRFNSLVASFLTQGLTGHSSSRDFVWMRGGVPKACFMKFKVDMHKTAQTQRALSYMKLWDTTLENYNKQASRFARGAWHTSTLWVRAEAQEELIASTILTLVILLSLAFLGMLLFTLDLVLSLYVVLATIGVLSMLAFFIIVIMQWPIGPIEVIALIVFLGYGVTYSLHIAHKYGGSDAIQSQRLGLGERLNIRYQRVDFALKALGGAAVGSSVTTIGCSIFLLFCTLTIFQKLGGVVLAVTFMSILTALVPLPALLLIAGPTHPGKKYAVGSVGELCQEFCAWCGSCCSCCCCCRRKSDADRVPPTSLALAVSDESKIPPTSPVAHPPVASPAYAAAAAPGRSVSPPPSAGPAAGERPSDRAVPAENEQATDSGISKREVQVDDVRVQALDKSFEIGEESPLDPVWAREVDPTSKAKSRSPSPSGRPDRPPKPVAQAMQVGPPGAGGRGKPVASQVAVPALKTSAPSPPNMSGAMRNPMYSRI